MTALAPLLEAFFTERLIGQRDASPHTVASYRDSFCLLLRFAQQRTGRPPHRLAIEDLDAALIGAFLNHLESNPSGAPASGPATSGSPPSAPCSPSPPTATPSTPRSSSGCWPSRPSAPTKPSSPISPRTRRRRCWTPRTDPRGSAGGTTHCSCSPSRPVSGVSELTGLVCADVRLGAGAHVRCHGKGRKERITPLRREARSVLRSWLDERRGSTDDALFPGPNGNRLSRDAVRRLVERHVATAAAACPSLASKEVTPHTLRHTCAMNLLRHGVDTATIALILGHEDVRTTYGVYLHADLGLKERAIAKTAPRTRPGRYRPPDSLLAFLEGL